MAGAQAQPLIELQAMAGNEVVNRLLDGHIQTKPVVGPVDDPAELQADRVAQAMLQRLGAVRPSVQRCGDPPPARPFRSAAGHRIVLEDVEPAEKIVISPEAAGHRIVLEDVEPAEKIVISPEAAGPIVLKSAAAKIVITLGPGMEDLVLPTVPLKVTSGIGPRGAELPPSLRINAGVRINADALEIP